MKYYSWDSKFNSIKGLLSESDKLNTVRKEYKKNYKKQLEDLQEKIGKITEKIEKKFKKLGISPLSPQLRRQI